MTWGDIVGAAARRPLISVVSRSEGACSSVNTNEHVCKLNSLPQVEDMLSLLFFEIFFLSRLYVHCFILSFPEYDTVQSFNQHANSVYCMDFLYWHGFAEKMYCGFFYGSL